MAKLNESNKAHLDELILQVVTQIEVGSGLKGFGKRLSMLTDDGTVLDMMISVNERVYHEALK
jgi:hypothetical protein